MILTTNVDSTVANRALIPLGTFRPADCQPARAYSAFASCEVSGTKSSGEVVEGGVFTLGVVVALDVVKDFLKLKRSCERTAPLIACRQALSFQTLCPAQESSSKTRKVLESLIATSRVGTLIFTRCVTPGRLSFSGTGSRNAAR